MYSWDSSRVPRFTLLEQPDSTPARPYISHKRHLAFGSICSMGACESAAIRTSPARHRRLAGRALSSEQERPGGVDCDRQPRRQSGPGSVLLPPGHMKGIGLAIASTCDLYDLETAGGTAGAALYARSREATPAAPVASQYVARKRSRWPAGRFERACRSMKTSSRTRLRNQEPPETTPTGSAPPESRKRTRTADPGAEATPENQRITAST